MPGEILVVNGMNANIQTYLSSHAAWLSLVTLQQIASQFCGTHCGTLLLQGCFVQCRISATPDVKPIVHHAAQVPIILLDAESFGGHYSKLWLLPSHEGPGSLGVPRLYVYWKPLAPRRTR